MTFDFWRLRATVTVRIIYVRSTVIFHFGRSLGLGALGNGGVRRVMRLGHSKYRKEMVDDSSREYTGSRQVGFWCVYPNYFHSDSA